MGEVIRISNSFFQFFTNVWGKPNQSRFLVPTHILVHHSLTADQKIVDWFAIERYHKEVNNFSHIGYHFGIETITDRGNLAVLFGRPLWLAGAHTVGMNNKSIGICVIGNFDEISPTSEQYDKCAELCAWLSHIYAIPVKNIQPHSEYAEKTCPGKLFDMELLRNRTSQVLLTRWV